MVLHEFRSHLPGRTKALQVTTLTKKESDWKEHLLVMLMAVKYRV